MVTDRSILPADSDTLIRISGVSKKFCLSLKKSLWYGLCDMGRELTGRRRGGGKLVAQTSQQGAGSIASGSGVGDQGQENHPRPAGLRAKEFWAVNNVSFELKRGECLGLIGRNGAGKTTLLKMLNGLIKPDAGRIEMRGRVGALIALGAGFNPVLTGRENIYVNGSVLGLTKKEIDAKLDEIVDFAEIGDFIDTPVQNYSSGMAVRLGFAVASSLNPDILLADEVLAVGDAGFKAKCYRRLSSLLNTGISVIFVSHETASVQRICSKCLWLRDGRVASYGDTSAVISRYSIWLDQQGLDAQNGMREEVGKNRLMGAKILEVAAVAPDGSTLERVETGKELRIRMTYEVDQSIPGLNASLSFRAREEALYNAYLTANDGVAISPKIGRSYVDLIIPELGLGPGIYWISAGLSDKNDIGFYDWNWDALKFEIHCDRKMLGRFSLPHRWEGAIVNAGGSS